MFAGYRGSFLSHQIGATSGSKKANITTLYVPYEFDGAGVPTKAHAIVVDPALGIQLVHGDGVFFALSHDVGIGEPGITWAMGPTAFGRISASEVLIHHPKIMLKGNIYLGAQPEAGAPLLPGPISPPCPSLFVSPV